MQLSAVLDIQNGFAFDSELFGAGGGVPLIRIRDLPNDTTETNYMGDFREEFMVRQGDFLIGMDGGFQCHEWHGPEALLNQRVCRMVNFSSLAEPRYVYYRVQDELSALERRASFVTVKHLSSKQILAIRIPLPPISEQRRIIEILDQADAIRKKRAEADKLAERILPALFYDMFGDPATNPNGWPVVPLGDVISDTRNGLYKHADYYGSGTQILKMYNIQAGVLNLARVDLVELTDHELDAYHLIPGDILLNRVNTPELVGKCAVIPASLGAAVFESKNIRVRLDSKRVTPEYVAHYLNSPPGHAALRSSVKHAIGMATVNNEGLRNVAIPLPPLSLQRVWSRAVRSNDGTRHNRADSGRIADTLLVVLLHRAFSGELTAKWREKNKALVAKEMAEQKMLLGSLPG